MKLTFFEIYFYGDQPSTCPKCGSRTEIIFDLSHSKNQSQVHQCPGCNFEFAMQSDTELITEKFTN